MRRLLAAIALGSTLAACGKAAPPPPESREPAADFSLLDPSGRAVKLADFKGKVILLDFWATWCGPCLEELPDLSVLHSRLASKGFSVVGVAVESISASEMRDFVKANAVPYPILLGGAGGVKGYRLMGIPTAFLIDRDGRIIRQYIGLKDAAALERDVVEAVAQPAATAPPAPAK